MSEDIKADFFGDGMKIFLDYVARQHKKNQEYRPHPIIRAFECAFQGIDKVGVGECTMGVSQDGTEESVYEPYVVVLQKQEDGIEVKEIRNIKVDKTLPIDLMLLIFRLQTHLDRIEGDSVNPQQMTDALNAVIPGNKFHAIGERWEEARDEFRRQLQERRIQLPNDPELLNELTKLRFDTPWEEYPNQVRALIGSSIAPSLSKDGGIVTITSPKDSRIEKYKVFDMATQFFLGHIAKYLNPPKAND